MSAADRVAALAVSMAASTGVDGSGALVSVGFSDVRIACSACSSSFGGCSDDAGSEAAEVEGSSASHLRCRLDELSVVSALRRGAKAPREVKERVWVDLHDAEGVDKSTLKAALRRQYLGNKKESASQLSHYCDKALHFEEIVEVLSVIAMVDLPAE